MSYFNDRDFIAGGIMFIVVVALCTVGIWELLKWLFSSLTITFSW